MLKENIESETIANELAPKSVFLNKRNHVHFFNIQPFI